MKTDEPTVVQLGIYVNSFYSFNEQTMVRVVMCAPPCTTRARH